MATELSAHPRWLRRITALLAVGATAATVAACGGGTQPGGNAGPADEGGTDPIVLSDTEWTDVVDAAKEEGEVVVYTSSGPTEAAFKRFNEFYPDINVTVVRQPTADLISRLDQEIGVNAAGADIAFHGQPQWYEDKGADKVLAPLKISPEAETAFADLEVGRYYVPMSRTPYSVSFNTNLGQPVANMEEFLQVMGNKPIGIVDAANSIPQAYQYYKWQELYGDDFLERLAANRPGIYNSGSTLAQSLASGEIAFGLGQSPGYIPDLVAQGAPVDEVVPDEGVVGAQYGPAVLSSAPHPNAAQVVVNWLMSPEGEKVFVEAQGGAVPLPVEGSLKWDAIEISPWTADDQDKWLSEEWNPVFRG